MSSSSRRDTIQISFGSTANAITAHSLNLQGLTVTTSSSSSSSSSEAVCDAQTTHYVDKNTHCWVPRVLMIDEPTRYFVPQISQQALLQQQQQQQQQPSLQLFGNSNSGAAVDGFDSFFGGHSHGIEAFVDPNLTLQHETPAWGAVHSNASVLAYSSHSRYYQEPAAAATVPSYKTSSSNPRHVVWDDDDDETEEEDPQERLARLQRQRNDWNRTTQGPLQEQLQNQVEWDDLFQNTTTNFMDFWMPPYSPKSCLALPYSRQSNLVSNWEDSYQCGIDSGNNNNALKEWKEDVLYENLRRFLEESDGCQGVMITTQGSGIYASLTTALLQEVQEECKSAGRIVYHVQQDDDDADSTSKKNTVVNDENNNQEQQQQQQKDWHSRHVDRLRRHVGSGLALQDFCENAHAVLPLRLPNYHHHTNNGNNFLKATAELALALETATLPFRFKQQLDPRYRIGLLNAPFFGGGGQDTQWGSSAQRLSVSQFLQCLQPSNSNSRYSILELDVLSSFSNYSTTTPSTLWNDIKAGTSVERDQRMRETSSSSSSSGSHAVVAPGGWLEDENSQPGGGLMTSLSQKTATKQEQQGGGTSSGVGRSAHHHFALSTSVRTVLNDDSYNKNNPYNKNDLMGDYSTCLIQGMGIRYRPERSMCTVLNQTLGQLTQQHDGGGAGAYWSKLITEDISQKPTVAVLGNSTRSYPHLDSICTELKTVLGSRYKGYYQRDLMNGIIPEREDCEEALANCLDIRDVYMPPGGGDDGDDDFY